MGRKTNGTKAPTRGGELLERRAASHVDAAEKLSVDASLVTRFISGERKPTRAQIDRMTALYRIPAAAWSEPMSAAAAGTEHAVERSSAYPFDGSSPLPPWLQRLCREGVTGVDHDDDERDRTACVIAETLKEHPGLIATALVEPITKHPGIVEDILEALRPYAGEEAPARTATAGGDE